MSIDPVLALQFVIVAVFLGLAITAVVVTLAVDRYKRAEDRATIAETLLDKHGINRKENP